MCRTQCLLPLVALYVGLAHSWDIAVGVRDQLIFYTDGTRTNNVTFTSREIAALAYDEVHNRMLYVDKQSNNDAICSYGISTRENKCFIKRTGSNIHSIAFDPATQTLFFTDTNDKSLNSISLKPGSANNFKANLLIKMDDRTPRDIAVDSCGGYIYWINTNITNNSKSSIERAQFDGSQRELINRRVEEFDVLSLVIDPLTRKIYYIDSYLDAGYSSVRYYLNHVPFNEREETIIYGSQYGPFSSPRELTVSKNYLYWVNNYNTVWQLPKNAIKDISKPKKISEFYTTEKALAIATNYKIEDQIQGLQDCEALSSVIPTITVTNNSLNIEQTTEYTTDAELFCIHGVHVSETSVCNCTPGYIGERCESSVCQNYCLHGNCIFNDEGLPTCSCNAGYTGERCEVSVCCGYCSNNGTCSLTEDSEPVCECKRDYVGDRCEVSDCLNYCIQGNCTMNDGGLPTCRCNTGYSGERCEVYTCHGYCLNDGDCSLNEEDEPVCQCASQHEGSRCEAVIDVIFTYPSTPTYDSAERKLTLSDLKSQCLNYCLQGTCSVTDEGLPLCRCSAGYSGQRCEVYACRGYCLNDGVCSLNEVREPVCQCAGNHKGLRCEAVKDVTFTVNNASTYYSTERNLTLADLLSNWRKPRAKVTVTVEV